MTLHTTITAGPTDRDQRIGAAQRRAAQKMQERPGGAVSTTSTAARVSEGLTCLVTQGPHSVIADLGPGMGGDAAGPSPSFYARAAVASCVAIAVKMLAATEGLNFNAVDVTVETDMDDLALFGIGPSSAAPLETRVDIEVTTAEAPADVARIVRTALQRDPWYLALRDRQEVTATVRTKPRP